MKRKLYKAIEEFAYTYYNHKRPHFYNNHKKEMIEFKNKIKNFFRKELCKLIKSYIENKIERMENLLNEKIY